MFTMKLTEIIKITDAELVANNKYQSDCTVCGITTDSRKIKAGVLFVALKGENFNGEDFAQDALKKGAAAVIVSKNADIAKISGVFLKVEDTLTAYQLLAKSWREKFNIPVVAITGSTGKTSTKDLTAAAISGLGEVQKTSANFNNEIGVPLTLLGIENLQAAAVVEIGMRGLHQIENLAKFVQPTLAIVTNVNETHIEILGSIENIAKAKSELVQAIPAGGTVILNADDKFVLAMKNQAKPSTKIFTYAIDNQADFTAKNISISETSTKFTCVHCSNSFDFEIPLTGRHNVLNALAGIAAAVSLGLTFEQIQLGFSNLAKTSARFEVLERNNFKIINDAYNASPASMRASIQTVAEIYPGRKIAVLGDMLELGDISEKVHRQVGIQLVKNNFDVLITIGELGNFIAAGAKSAGLKNIFTTTTHAEAADKIKSIVQAGDTILFKASHGMHLEKIIELI